MIISSNWYRYFFYRYQLFFLIDTDIFSDTDTDTDTWNTDTDYTDTWNSDTDVFVSVMVSGWLLTFILSTPRLEYLFTFTSTFGKCSKRLWWWWVVVVCKPTLVFRLLLSVELNNIFGFTLQLWTCFYSTLPD